MKTELKSLKITTAICLIIILLLSTIVGLILTPFIIALVILLISLKKRYENIIYKEINKNK